MDDREPLEANADPSVQPDFHLGRLQREALTTLTDGFRGSVGIAILKSGYAKLIYYDADGNVIDTELLHAHYGDAVMPTGLPEMVSEYERQRGA